MTAVTCEHSIRTLIDCLWATTGKIDPTKFKIGVNEVGWKELCVNEKISKMTFHVRGTVYDVVLVPGLPEDKVALIWQ